MGDERAIVAVPPGGQTGPRAIGTELKALLPVLHGVVERMVFIRRNIHAHPELSWEEARTSGVIADELVRMGLSPIPLSTGTGVRVRRGRSERRSHGGVASRP